MPITYGVCGYFREYCKALRIIAPPFPIRTDDYVQNE